MKVELLVNLKIGSGRVIPAGTVFSDEVEPIPEFIMNRLRRRMAKELVDNKKVIPLDFSGGVPLGPTSNANKEKVATFKARTEKKEKPVEEKVATFKARTEKKEKPVVTKPKKSLLKKETSLED